MQEKQRDVPLWAWLAYRRKDKENEYGSIPDLPDDELADPEELERQVFLEEWGPILQLPTHPRSPIKPNIDEYFGVNWGAFATVDFERITGSLNKAKYREEKLREEHRWLIIRVGSSASHLPESARCEVLKELDRGTIGLGDIVDDDMRKAAELHLRATRVLREITEIVEARKRRQERAVEAMFGRW